MLVRFMSGLSLPIAGHAVNISLIPRPRASTKPPAVYSRAGAAASSQQEFSGFGAVMRILGAASPNAFRNYLRIPSSPPRAIALHLNEYARPNLARQHGPIRPARVPVVLIPRRDRRPAASFGAQAAGSPGTAAGTAEGPQSKPRWPVPMGGAGDQTRKAWSASGMVRVRVLRAVPRVVPEREGAGDCRGWDAQRRVLD